MSFISKIIPTKKVLIIDVGTYKVKVALCEYKNGEVKIISFGEKKQENSNIFGSEIASIQGVIETISQAIQKATKDTNFNPKDIIINIPTSTIISCGEKIEYQRVDKNEEISIEELDFIIGKIENKALNIAKNEIYKKTGFLDVDMKLITSSITDINIDGLRVSNPLSFTGKNISLQTLNIFIPTSRYNIIQTISNNLNKNISSIIPLEFSIPKILSGSNYDLEDVLFLDIGNTKTSIIIQKKGVTIGFDRIEVGINDLIKKIKENHNLTTINILKNIQNNDLFLKEKNDFLNVFETGIIISIKEILKENINIPNNFLLIGGGNYGFIKDKIKEINWSENMLYLNKDIQFIEINKENLDIKGINIDINSSNLGIISMILASKYMIFSKQNKVLDLLKNFLDQNEL